MSIVPRVIPVLLLSQHRFVKTQKFGSPIYIGDPINTIRIFNEKEVDEIIIIDIDASKQSKAPDFKFIEDLAAECFMPLTYGGGVKSIEHAKQLFSLGIEKICVQSEFRRRPEFIANLSDRFGKQSVIASIDVKANILGQKNIYYPEKKKTSSSRLEDVIQNYEQLGAGEILINSVDRDGTLMGPDLEVIRRCASVSSIPITAIGGISSMRDIVDAWKAGANGIGAGSFFVFHGPHRAVLITYPKREELEAHFI